MLILEEALKSSRGRCRRIVGGEVGDEVGRVVFRDECKELHRKQLEDVVDCHTRLMVVEQSNLVAVVAAVRNDVAEEVHNQEVVWTDDDSTDVLVVEGHTDVAYAALVVLILLKRQLMVEEEDSMVVLDEHGSVAALVVGEEEAEEEQVGLPVLGAIFLLAILAR